MKRKKILTVTALVFTCATIASCGKTTETVNAEPVIQATEQIVLETEEIIQVSADQGEGDSITLEPTTDENGQLIYPDYPEEYIKYSPIEPVDLWVIKQVPEYNNPNATRGELVKLGMSLPGNTLKVDATCELDGVAYYRIVPINNDNQFLIVEQDALQDTPPEEGAYISMDDGIEITPEEQAEIDRIEQEALGDEFTNPDNYNPSGVEDIDVTSVPSLEDAPDDLLDAASRLQWE